MKLTPELKDIALKVAGEIEQEGWQVEDGLIEFAERFLAALPNSEPEVSDDMLLAYQVGAESIKRQLVESQAREAKLNSVLCEIAASKSLTATPTQFYQHLQRVASNATFESFVATALNELIAKAGEVMRVKCRRELLGKSIQLDTIHVITNAIRAIPCMSLEDLK